MKKLALASAVALALSTAGCAQFDNWLQTNVINPTASLVQNPNTVLIVNGLKVAAQIAAQDTQALSCVIAAGSAVASEIESNPAFKTGASLTGTTLKVNVTSSAVCQSLSGILSGAVSVPAGSAVVAPAK